MVGGNCKFGNFGCSCGGEAELGRGLSVHAAEERRGEERRVAERMEPSSTEQSAEGRGGRIPRA